VSFWEGKKRREVREKGDGRPWRREDGVRGSKQVEFRDSVTDGRSQH
jgi:hypothetical protein